MGGSFQTFMADPQSAIPAVCGRFGVAGKAIYGTTSGGGLTVARLRRQPVPDLSDYPLGAGTDQCRRQLQGERHDLHLRLGRGLQSTGIIKAGTFTRFATQYTLDIGGNAINNAYKSEMAMVYQLGALGAAALQPGLILDSGPLTEWDSAHKLSNFAAAFYINRFDAAVNGGSMPKPLWTLEGYPVYDPRLI